MNKSMNYGYALYNLAAEERYEVEIERDFSEVVNVIQDNQEFIPLLLNSRIPMKERIQILDDIFKDKIHPYLLSTLKILTENGEINLITDCYNSYRAKYFEDKNIVLVTVYSAVKLKDTQKEEIIIRLEEKMKKSIILENIIDKECIGGVRITYPGNMIDSSIKNRFDKLQKDLRNADYSQMEV